MVAERAEPPLHLLFTYGTLQQADVQLDTLGRLLDGDDVDVLAGYTTEHGGSDIRRGDELRGASAHPILRETGSPLDKVVGRVLRVAEDELDAFDEYQAAVRRRASVVLASGRTAWVYVAV